MPLQWTTALQNQVALQVTGKLYSELRTNEKTLLDNTAAVLPTGSPGGLAGHALTYLLQYSQWYEQAGFASTNITAWDHVLCAEICARFALALKYPDAKSHFSMVARAWTAAVESYSSIDGSLTGAGTVQTSDLSVMYVRKYVIDNLIRIKPRPFYCPWQTIDRNCAWAFNWIWNKSAWNFRKRQCTMTIPTAGGGSAPTFDLPNGETVDAMAQMLLYYTDTGYEGVRIQPINADNASRSRATLTEDDRPMYYRVENRGGSTRYWHFMPQPDQQYTATAEVCIAAPPFPSDAADTLTFKRLPTEFSQLLLELTLGKCMETLDGGSKRREAENQVMSLAPAFDDKGPPEQMYSSPTDVCGEHQPWNRGVFVDRM